jgi:hypothetical protein
VAVKTFAPQLQTTFVKALADPARSVRAKAAAGLGKVSRMGDLKMFFTCRSSHPVCEA